MILRFPQYSFASHPQIRQRAHHEQLMGVLRQALVANFSKSRPAFDHAARMLDLSGSLFPEPFFVELGASISVASTTVPVRSSIPRDTSSALTVSRIFYATRCCPSRPEIPACGSYSASDQSQNGQNSPGCSRPGDARRRAAPALSNPSVIYAGASASSA